MSKSAFFPFEDFELLLPYLDRSHFCEFTGISQQTISSKLYRRRNGSDVSFDLHQSEMIRAYLFDLMDKLEIVLVEPPDEEE